MPRGLPTNLLAFGVSIATQQLLVFPLLAGSLGATDFAGVVLFTSIYAVACNAFGEELANARLTHATQFHESNGMPATRVLLTIALGIAALGSILVVASSQLSRPDGQLIVVCMVLGVLRAYSLAEMRIASHFSSILVCNLAYLAGSIVGLLIFRHGSGPFIVFVSAEIAALGTVALMRAGVHAAAAPPDAPDAPDAKDSFKRLFITYMQFAAVSMLMNAIGYLDRLVAIPLIGAAALSVYFAVSSWAKLLAMVANPVSGVVLSQVARTPSSEGRRVVTEFVKRLPALVAVALVLAVAASWVGVSVLYPQFKQDAWNLYLPAAFAASLGIVSALARPIMIRFYRPVAQFIIHIAHGLALVLFLFAWSRFGVSGFAWAIAAARSVQAISCVLILNIGASK